MTPVPPADGAFRSSTVQIGIDFSMRLMTDRLHIVHVREMIAELAAGKLEVQFG